MRSNSRRIARRSRRSSTPSAPIDPSSRGSRNTTTARSTARFDRSGRTPRFAPSWRRRSDDARGRWSRRERRRTPRRRTFAGTPPNARSRLRRARRRRRRNWRRRSRAKRPRRRARRRRWRRRRLRRRRGWTCDARRRRRRAGGKPRATPSDYWRRSSARCRRIFRARTCSWRRVRGDCPWSRGRSRRTEAIPGTGRAPTRAGATRTRVPS